MASALTDLAERLKDLAHGADFFFRIICPGVGAFQPVGLVEQAKIIQVGLHGAFVHRHGDDAQHHLDHQGGIFQVDHIFPQHRPPLVQDLLSVTSAVGQVQQENIAGEFLFDLLKNLLRLDIRCQRLAEVLHGGGRR